MVRQTVITGISGNRNLCRQSVNWAGRVHSSRPRKESFGNVARRERIDLASLRRFGARVVLGFLILSLSVEIGAGFGVGCGFGVGWGFGGAE